MSRTNAMRAYSVIKEKIITTRLAPGATIDEAALVRELGLGRTPIREACKRLEVEGLIVVMPRRGMYVAEVTLSQLRELQEVRLELEGLCARLAVERITEAEIDHLERLLEESQEGAIADATASNWRGFREIDRELHRVIWRASRNSLLESECSRLFEFYERMWYHFFDRLEAQARHEDYFDDIIETVSARDAKGAEEAVRRHCQQSHDAIRQAV